MKVYLVTKNADFIEGRGPMIPHKIFKNKESARDYISTKKGIFGSPQYSVPAIYSDGSEGWNGYEINEFLLIEDFSLQKYNEEQDKIREIKNKIEELKKEIKELEIKYG